MFINFIGFIVGLMALLGAGIFSYTYFEKMAGPTSVTFDTPSVPVAGTSSPAVIPAKIVAKAPLNSPKVTTNIAVKKIDVIPTLTSKQVVVPGPLRNLVMVPTPQTPSSNLTINGVLVYGNKARADNGGLPPLTENIILNRVAQMKVDDMFAKQYFEHQSPTGIGPGDLAKNAGYEFVIVGENLALGDFEGDKGLVDAWMASPGHRANILNSRYQEIGVAVGNGMYEGRKTWLAVQSFGLPLSACPAIDNEMKDKIAANTTELANLRRNLNDQKTQIDATPHNDPNYNSYVEKFNALVPVYNALVEVNRALVALYNIQVQAFNACINTVTN